MSRHQSVHICVIVVLTLLGTLVSTTLVAWLSYPGALSGSLLVYSPNDSDNSSSPPMLNFTPPIPPLKRADWRKFLTPTTNFSSPNPIEVEVITGLTGRLRVLVSYLAVARAERRRLIVHWVPEEQCPSTFDALFEPIGSDVTILDSRWSMRFEYRTHTAYTTKSLDDERGTLMAEMVMRLIRPRPALAVRIDTLLQRLGGAGDFSAVHIRRTDMGHVMGESYGGYKTFLEWSKAGIAEGRGSRPSLQRIFVAADHPNSLGVMREGVGKEHIISQDAFYPLLSAQLRLTSVDVAVVDMWTASYAARFLGSPQSSFSSFIEALRRARRLKRSPSFGCAWCR